MRRRILLRENKIALSRWFVFFFSTDSNILSFRTGVFLVKEQAGSRVWRQSAGSCLSPEPELAFTLSNSSDRRPRQNHFSRLTIHTLCGGLNNGPQICPYPCPRNLGTLPSMARGNVQVRLRILKWDEYPELSRCLSRAHLP